MEPHNGMIGAGSFKTVSRISRRWNVLSHFLRLNAALSCTTEALYRSGSTHASLLDPKDPQQAWRRTVIAVTGEYIRLAGEADDPLEEDQDTPELTC